MPSHLKPKLTIPTTSTRPLELTTTRGPPESPFRKNIENKINLITVYISVSVSVSMYVSVSVSASASVSASVSVSVSVSVCLSLRRTLIMISHSHYVGLSVGLSVPCLSVYAPPLPPLSRCVFVCLSASLSLYLFFFLFSVCMCNYLPEKLASHRISNKHHDVYFSVFLPT
jgi:hypothetical protein